MIDDASGRARQLRSIATALRDEHDDLDCLVADLAEADWSRPTPAEGWSIGDQIGHLSYFDSAAAGAIDHPGIFTANIAALRPEAPITEHLQRSRNMSSSALLSWWRAGRKELLDAVSRIDSGSRIPWYGPTMSPASFVSARLMEAWVHGQDVADALDVRRDPTDRLFHVAQLGIRSRAFSNALHGKAAPENDVFVELRAPSGAQWCWGDSGARSCIRGDALDFCLVVTQRRHPDDTWLEVIGEPACVWMSTAQAYAGPPGAGRRANQFPRQLR